MSLEYPDSFALNFGLDQRMKCVVRAELHVKAKLAGEHIFKCDQFHKPESFRIEVYEHIEVTVWPPLTPCPRAVDIKRSRPKGFCSPGSRPNTLHNLGSAHIGSSSFPYVRENLANFQLCLLFGISAAALAKSTDTALLTELPEILSSQRRTRRLCRSRFDPIAIS